jgi:hypothetical protein
MNYNSIVISSGHGLYVRGACGVIDEVDQARLVVDTLADILRAGGIDVKTFHDDTSRSQNENLNTIVNYHNAQTRDLDISVHFNAYVETEKPMGTEVLYVTQSSLASKISKAIAEAGFIDRGAKKRTDLFFLNNTEMPAVLLEICFVDSETDACIYDVNFQTICENIAGALGVYSDIDTPPPVTDNLVVFSGPCSKFGGPNDLGVDDDEGLAFINDVMDAPQLFLPYQPEDTTGLARRLNPYVHYVACRWDYTITPKASLLLDVALVIAKKTGIALAAFPADWGPHSDTGRAADLSPGLMADLGIDTDDEVEVIYPWRS